MGAKELSETAREREVFKYYQPTLGTTSQDAPFTPRSSNDATLSAFAQLGSLRLNAKRGMISLIAREHRYIIAEATRTLSLQSDAVHDSFDELWKGEQTVRRNEGPCSIAFDIFIGASDGARDCFVANDLSVDGRFCHMDYVAGPPFVKFYVSVPIISPKGLVIGTFSVLDDKPRGGISDAHIAFMKDISSTIMDHLESNRTKQQHQRAERMIRGLGLYVEGKSSIRDWWLNTGHKINDFEVNERLRRGESLAQQADEEFGVQDAPDGLGSALIVGMPSTTSRGGSTSSKSALGSKSILTPAVSNESRPQYFRTHSDTSASAAASEGFDTTFIQPPDNSDTTFSRNDSQSRQNPSFPIDDNSGARLQEATLTNELRESFSRASNLIRESIAVDGALFLDASIGTFGGNSSKSDIGFSGPSARIDAHGSTSLSTSSSDDAKRRQRADAAASQKTCGILGYSTSTRSSLNMHEPAALHLNVAESFLRKLLRRYPHGKVFNFDEEGSLSSSEDEIRRTLNNDVGIIAEEPIDPADEARHQRRKKRRMSKDAEAKKISRLLPGARSVAFFPLWDSHKERWFSGSVVWTKNPTRVLDPDEDLTYLASFGNSIMAEVARLDALLKSQLKNSFVSSISHELRSPLHGVLASVEFLQDSPLNALQQEMINIIGSCGRTLLDTINHVLDFTKSMSIAKDKPQDHEKSRNRKSNRASEPSELSSRSTNPVDIRVLTEEVLEGVYTGSGFGKNPSIASDKKSTSDFSLSDSPVLPPMVFVSMDWRSDWGFDIDPGAWRRLVMNVFGNALKYTETGFIRVSLGCRTEKKASKGTASFITLTVADSGKGISKEFLNHHLYTPFAQEDSLAVGSGLGLSIVRNIVNELAGSISIESEQDSGTDVTISLPLSVAKLPALLAGEQDEIIQLRKQVHGLEVCLVGFDLFPSLGDEPTGILSMEARQLFYFKDSLTALFRDWFSMKVAASAGLAPSTAVVSVIMESTFNNLLADGFHETETGGPEVQKSVLLVLCASLHGSYQTITHRNFEVYYVQQPIGPHKLANTLARCLATKESTDNRPSATAAADSATPDVVESSQGRGQLPAVASVAQRPPLSLRVSSKGSTARSKTIVFSPPPLSPSSSTSDEDKSNDGPRASIATTIATTPSAANSSSSPPHVLLVEDNSINLKLLVTYMEKLGIEYTTANNGLQALKSYQDADSPFALVIMDISMPVMNGLEASRNIRLFEQESNKSRVPIVAVTGAASESARQEAFSAGIDQFLTKPVSLKVLKGFVEQYDLIDQKG